MFYMYYELKCVTVIGGGCVTGLLIRLSERREYHFLSHARTVVPECFKDDNASQWKSGKFDSLSPEPS